MKYPEIDTTFSEIDLTRATHSSVDIKISTNDSLSMSFGWLILCGDAVGYVHEPVMRRKSLWLVRV